MSAASEHNLSGQWTGIFNYPSLLPPNTFDVTIRDLGESITGVTVEEDDDPDGSGGILHAVIEGRRKGNVIFFTKIYDDLDRALDAVHYVGTVQPDGNEIGGRWEIPGVWSGTFLMIRAKGSAQSVERDASEKLEAAR